MRNRSSASAMIGQEDHMAEPTIGQRLQNLINSDGAQQVVDLVKTRGKEAIDQVREQLTEGSELRQTAGQVIAGLQARMQGQLVQQVPSTGQAARAMLADVQIDTGRKLTTKEEIAPAHRLLTEKYKDSYTETLKAEVEYAKDSSYEIRLVTDKKSGEAYGVASGWHLGKTGFQIDYLSPIEFPREGQETRDVTAGLAIMRQMANRHHSSGLWVEVDEDMRKHYAAAGFKEIATPHPEDPAQLTMMYLPLTSEAKKRFEEDPNGLWKDHVQAWYAANWDSLKGPDSAEAREAIRQMHSAADNGKRVWIQKLPD
jgi:hypothetical protein